VSELIRDDPAWLYQGLHGLIQTRRLRVWQLSPRHLVAIVTEKTGSDHGTSITNATEAIAGQLAAEHPGCTIDLIEHYTGRDPSAINDQGTGRPVYLFGLSAAVEGWEPDFRYSTFAVLPPAADHTDETFTRVDFDDRGRPSWTEIPTGALRDLLG
jgi:hypothetical protein